MRAAGIYLCKFRQSAVTKNGKPYENVILQDKTGTIDAKIWEPNSVGIDEFDSLDYIDIVGDVTSFAGPCRCPSNGCAGPEKMNTTRQIIFLPAGSGSRTCIRN